MTTPATTGDVIDPAWLAALRVAADTDQRITSVDITAPTASDTLSRYRHEYLGYLDTVLADRHPRRVARLATLLDLHVAACGYTTDITGVDPIDQRTGNPVHDAVYDLLTTLLMWHLLGDRYRGQRIATLCGAAARQAAATEPDNT